MSSRSRPVSRAAGDAGPLRSGGNSRDKAEERHGSARQQRLVIAGSTINSMPRMRKSWLRTADTPKELRPSLGRNSHRPDTSGRSADGNESSSHRSPLDAISHLRSLEALGVELDGVQSVDRETMRQLEATFLQGLDGASSLGQDLSFLNDPDSGLTSMAESTRNLQSNSENVPPLNLPKTSGTKGPRKSRNASTAAHSRPEQTGPGKDDVQPFLGAQLKRNLGKLGLCRQQVSLEPDEWDDESSINMLGGNFGSKEEERLAKHEQWYSKNLGPAFMRKRCEALAREGEKLPDHQVIKRLSSHGRLSLVVANQDDWRTSKTRSLLSKGSAQLLYTDPGDDISMADLMRSRSHDHKVGTRHGVPWPRNESSRSRSQARSGSCPPLLAPNARDRLRLSTRFLDSRGQICKASASKVFSQEFSQENLQSWSRFGESGGESLDSSVHSKSYASVQRPDSSQKSHEKSASPALSRQQPNNTSPSTVLRSSRPQTPETETKHFVSQHTVYPGLHGTQRTGVKTVRSGHGRKEEQDKEHRENQRRSPSHLLVDEVSSWNVYSPGREEMTPLDSLIQEKEGHYIRSPTRNFDIHEADLLREMRAKNITLSPATRILREKHGHGHDDYDAAKLKHLGDQHLDGSELLAPINMSLPSPDSRLLDQTSAAGDSPFSKLRMESIMNKALHEHPAFADSLPILEDDAVGNCF